MSGFAFCISEDIPKHSGVEDVVLTMWDSGKLSHHLWTILFGF